MSLKKKVVDFVTGPCYFCGSARRERTKAELAKRGVRRGEATPNVPGMYPLTAAKKKPGQS